MKMVPTSHELVVDWLDSHTAPLPAEKIPTAEAVGRVLAVPVDASVNHPPAALAEVDGFALLSEATVGSSDYNPLSFRVGSLHGPKMESGQAWPVASGEPLPEGADTVIPLAEIDLRGEVLEVYAPRAPGESVIPAGSEVKAGDQVLAAGRVLRPTDIALLTVLDLSEVSVVRRPRVRILVLRDDVRDAGGPMIRVLASCDGAACAAPELPDCGALGDALMRGDGDLLLLIGGSGFGANDHAAAALARAGEVAFRGVAINPGETAAVGRVESTPVVILPGPPVASLFVYDMLGARAVRRLAGRDPGWPYGTRWATLCGKISSSLGRLECCRVRIVDGRAEPIAVSDGRTLSTVVRADGFVLIPATSEGFAQDSEVIVYLYDQRL